MTNVRALGCALLALLRSCWLRPATASAQTYPSTPVRMIVPFAAGGPTDVIARIVAQKLSESLGPAVRTSRTCRAPAAIPASPWRRARRADGYTILVVSTGFIVNPSLYAKVPYDPIKDFAPDHAGRLLAQRASRSIRTVPAKTRARS